ncbi:transcriptional regulator FeaR [Pantoea sp. Tr-811]|uniref:transcriptional regulator FeaR n=1 Tax=unclassified Pantoea TaxID=2630326 RepID=UPI001420AF14|nr:MULTISPECIES: transcriptional regulator FeaR [unclassified Pantoea]NIE75137.1 transcriptional regulator FeaR [Pantoea sp. Ap-967]NIF25001.1 transcriptional regulator FeaR [Pantoea sp. Tr-811]
MHTQQSDRQGLEHWTLAMQQICGRFETALASTPSLFIGEVSASSRAGLPVANLRTNAGTIRRLGENPALDDDQHCFLVSQRSGHSSVMQGGTRISLAPGELLLMDSVGPCEINPNGLIEHVSLALPRSQVRRHMAGDGVMFGKISSTNACGRMLHMLMDQLCKEGSSGEDGAQGEALQSAFIALLEPGLERGAGGPCSFASLSGANLRGYVQQVIDESLSQPGLTPAHLAGRLNISVRHLYRLFEEEGDSVCRYIQRARLKRSADDLANPFYRGESITSIAYKWGFTDSAHFSRSFKKQFEQSPKDYRAQAMA